MLNWIVLKRTDYLHKMDLALNNLQRLICHKIQQTKLNQMHFSVIAKILLFIEERSYSSAEGIVGLL